MKMAYFDCFSGVSGNMVLGAFIDLGLDVERLKGELNKLEVADWDLKIKKVRKGVIAGTYVNVISVSDSHQPRRFSDITALIDKSGLAEKAAGMAKKIFFNLAKAEAKIHNTDIHEVHFHEIGAVDSIIDIVGTAVAVELLGLDTIFVSPVHVGRGFVDCSHGKLPVPCPAAAELLKGVPVFSNGYEKELVTPTGAAIITAYAKSYGPMPLMTIKKIGYGAGDADLEIPHLLRIFVGEV